jgi:hypothetical protein
VGWRSPSQVKPKTRKFVIAAFTKHVSLRSKSKGLDQYQDNVIQWNSIFIWRLLFHWASVIKIQMSILVLYNADIIISSKYNLFLPWSGADPGIQVMGGGGAHLKKLRRVEGGTKIFGVFRVKNHDFTPKNHIFSNFRGGGTSQVHPPLDPPLMIYLKHCSHGVKQQSLTLSHKLTNISDILIAFGLYVILTTICSQLLWSLWFICNPNYNMFTALVIPLVYM